MSESRMTSKGQVTVPKKVRDHLKVSPGDRLDFHVKKDGTVVVRTRKLHAKDLFGIFTSKTRGITVEAMNEAILKSGGRP